MHSKDSHLSERMLRQAPNTERAKVALPSGKTSGCVSPFSEEPSVDPKKSQPSQYYTIDEQSMNEMFQTSNDGGDSVTMGRPIGTREYINAKKRAIIRQQNFQNIKQKVI
mmetsp:Transcript_4204/g.6225  ORF Transcript_4204/g.6225 Transcript_4204/m.6225 type:complete len:110 (+) Transcript_4204:359-688(+)